MCDFICQENIKSLIDHIVSQHLSAKKSASSSTDDNKSKSSLEEIANPHVTTFQHLRRAYEKNHNLKDQPGNEPSLLDGNLNNINQSDDGLVVNGCRRPTLNKSALEDQVSLINFPTITELREIIFYVSCVVTVYKMHCSANFIRRTKTIRTSMMTMIKEMMLHREMSHRKS